MVIETMAAQGKEPTFCMGDDIPLAILSQKPHTLYDYFKQRFAQVWYIYFTTLSSQIHNYFKQLFAQVHYNLFQSG
jgi:hypothetical protein